MSGVNYPTRSPIAVAKTIAPLIQGKTVCDLGCGHGEMLSAFSAMEAKHVIGLEHDPELCVVARQKGFEVIEGNILEMAIPEADVYYDWTPLPTALKVIDRISSGIIIVGNFPHANGKLDIYNGIRLNIHFNEREKDEIFQITIIDKR